MRSIPLAQGKTLFQILEFFIVHETLGEQRVNPKFHLTENRLTREVLVNIQTQHAAIPSRLVIAVLIPCRFQFLAQDAIIAFQLGHPAIIIIVGITIFVLITFNPVHADKQLQPRALGDSFRVIPHNILILHGMHIAHRFSHIVFTAIQHQCSDNHRLK